MIEANISANWRQKKSTPVTPKFTNVSSDGCICYTWEKFPYFHFTKNAKAVDIMSKC